MAVNADDIRPEELEDGVHEPNSYYNVKDLTLTVWFEYDKQEDITECLIKK